MGGQPPFRGAIFDLGNVLIQLRPLGFLARGAGGPEARGDALADPLSRLRADPVLDRFERGQATEAEFYQAVRRALGGSLSDPEIETAYLSILGEPMVGMAELVCELRERGVRTVGLTDISPAHLALVSRYPAVAALERVIASCVTGHRKPEAGAYRAALEFLGTEPGETLFVDDRPENTAGARAVGLCAVEFAGPEALRAHLGLTQERP